ncbi:DUF262 domain-containing HNH endonuclease family protein [Ruminococcus sp.]|uniref:DUF262 domain-containing protein n=1 Tax=Ruminococcus sp. TaxID=41978 RepID=UPI0025EC41A5|nr:DUF262 domain-containing HNH endonuclease family protein [Ruminococcus sp.]MCR4638956.1 DUF262 domain-containing HNH endonuclease family protein [Ruminococcus sp.]
MAATIEVNKQSVKTLLSSGIENPFVIPEYQRPYAWSYDQVNTLFDDIWDFTQNDGGSKRNATYFLGCVVSYENKGNQEIIDGQQRITSLFLLLRAIYTKLEQGTQSKESDNFLKQIRECIWRANKLTAEVDFDDILLTSRVINNEGNEILREILKTGIANNKADDNYSKNYIRFQELLDEASKNDPLMIYDFIYALLHQAILLPITADTQSTALRIFSTLNDRGMPLSDADIFKAEIYNKKSSDDKKDFIEDWKDLDEKARYAGESIQQLFYYYMFYLRAKEKDSNSTTPGVRKYFLEGKSIKLFEDSLMNNLRTILNVWLVITKRETIEDEEWSTDASILRVLDILSSYPNEFWKYPVIIYYLQHRESENFKDTFIIFLRNLLAELLSRYLLFPTINAVKGDILKLNVSIIDSEHPMFNFKDIDLTQLSNAIKAPNRNAVRMLLKIIAYRNSEQTDLLPQSWEIEHIFPQKWQTNYFPDVKEDVIKEKIEHIGNKLPFEKRLNITAGNGYFGKKKVEYAKSAVACTKEMASSAINEWSLDDITERDIQIANDIKSIIEKWKNDYQVPIQATISEPTDEQKAMIEQFKKNGWV